MSVGISPVAVASTDVFIYDVVVVDAAGAVRVSTDSGTTWSDPTGGTGVGLAPVAVLADVTGSGWYGVASAAGQVRVSTDGGATWTDQGSIGINPVALAGTFSEMLAIDAVGNVRRSTDGGATWTTPAGSPII